MGDLTLQQHHFNSNDRPKDLQVIKILKLLVKLLQGRSRMKSKLGENRRESLQNIKGKKEKSTDSFALEKSFEKNFHTVDNKHRRGTVEEAEEEHN